MIKKNLPYFKWNFNNAIKLSVVIVILLYLVHSITSMRTTTDELGALNQILAKQTLQFDNMQERGDKEIKKVQQGISQGASDMKAAGDDFKKRMDKFHDDFVGGLDKYFSEIKESNRYNFTQHFFENHVKYYDEESYEVDRQKAIADTHYDLPDYKAYARLRETALRCHMDDYNKSEATYYKNQIARLKAAHREDLIKTVKKPIVWTWPLTLERTEEIFSNNFNLFFTALTKEGTCRHA